MWMALRLASSRSPLNMPLQLPAESRWCASGSAYCSSLLQRLFCGLDMRRAIYGWDKGQYSFGTSISHGGPLSPASTSRAFHFSGLKEFLLGSLTSTVSWSFLLAKSSLPNVDGLASAAILANCWVGDDSGDLPTSSNFSPLPSSFLFCLGLEGLHIRYWRFCSTGGSTGAACTSAHVFISRAFLASPIWDVFTVLAILELKETSQHNFCLAFHFATILSKKNVQRME